MPVAPDIKLANPSAATADQRVASPVLQFILLMDDLARKHPGLISAFVIVSVLAVALGYLRGSSDFPLALTYAFPLAVCTYGIGLVAGVITAVVLAVFWFLEALARGLGQNEAVLVFAVRLGEHLVIVGMAAMAAAAARAREQYIGAQQQLDRLRGDLIAAFSHDLRSPLSAIVGFADILRNGGGSVPAGAAEETAERILANAHRLDRLIGDMLNAGREDQVAPVSVDALDAAALVEELRAELDCDRTNGAVRLEWIVDPGTPPLRTDRSKVVSVVRNLVSNSLKFTSAGSVTIRIGFDAAAGAHRIEVVDTGPGIPPDALPYVFERFYRVSDQRRTPGFGLGLFIVKRFTAMLNGTVTARSEPGQGTTFSVTLPPLAGDGAGPADRLLGAGI